MAQGIRPLRGIYIPNFGQISVKISVFGVLLCPYRCTDAGEIWHGGVDLRRFALHAMLPVKNNTTKT